MLGGSPPPPGGTDRWHRTSASQQVEFAPKGPVKGVKGPSGKRDLIRKFCQPIRAVGADAKIKTSGGVRRESP